MRDPYFPFHALGFHSNPFRALDDDEWAAIVLLPPALAEAAARGGHLQVLGERGRGKTSALLGLAAQWRSAGQRAAYEYLPEGRDGFKTVLAGLEVFLLDEAQRLRGGERRRLLRAAAGGLRLVLGSHDDLTPLFARAGLPLASVRLEAGDTAHLAALLARRLDYSALQPGQPGVTFEAGAVAFLASIFGSDLRAMERFLYEVFQDLEAPGTLTAEELRAARARLAGQAH